MISLLGGGCSGSSCVESVPPVLCRDRLRRLGSCVDPGQCRERSGKYSGFCPHPSTVCCIGMVRYRGWALKTSEVGMQDYLKPYFSHNYRESVHHLPSFLYNAQYTLYNNTLYNCRPNEAFFGTLKQWHKVCVIIQYTLLSFSHKKHTNKKYSSWVLCVHWGKWGTQATETL